MRALSNFLRRNDSPGAGAEYRLARADELHDGIALVLGGNGSPAGAEQVMEFAQFASARGIDLHNLWLAGAGGRLAWAMMPILSPGKTMLLLTPPQLPQSLDAGPLIEAACQWFAHRGGYLAQALVEPGHTQIRQLFAGHKFKVIAELHYLQAALRRTLADVQLAEGLALHNYGEQTHGLFARAIRDSYVNSLDCPALNGVRDMEDIIAGHRASGEFDERFWFVLMENDEPCGVLLLNRVPRNELAELVYLGLSPPARGRGFADILIRQAFWAVREMGLHRITLAVDSQNAPALKLYYRYGFQQTGTKTAMLRDLRASGRKPTAES